MRSFQRRGKFMKQVPFAMALQESTMKQSNRSKQRQWLDKSYRVEDEQELIISIKNDHCRAIVAQSNQTATYRKNSTCCRPQQQLASSHVTSEATSLGQAMYSITSMQGLTNRRHLARPLRPPTASKCTPAVMRPFTSSRGNYSNLLRPSLLILALATFASSVLIPMRTEALFASPAASGDSGKPASTLPLASALISSVIDATSDKQAASSASAESPLFGALQKVVSAAVSAQQQQSSSQASPAHAQSPSSSAADFSSPQAAPPAAGSSPGSSAASSVANALVSSLSSAVASAAVSAAHNALSGGDARSLLTGSNNGAASSVAGSPAGSLGGASVTAHHPQRAPAIHLALKIAADAIPEVPYNILHNMKKLDHAAPFYHIGGKSGSLGNSKETSSFLASALSSASHGRFAGAAEQLSSLFKSPLWKRIADGYGDFTSEFRSLFRGPPNTMKGPTSSSSKLLRDISVPAMLMLIAAAMPSEWRPIRSRRKSLPPAMPDISQMMDPMSGSSSDQVSSISAIPLLNAAAAAGPAFNLFQSTPPKYQQIQPRDLNGISQLHAGQTDPTLAGSPQARSGDINLRHAESGIISQWEYPGLGMEQQSANHYGFQPASAIRHSVHVEPPSAPRQAARRAGEIVLPANLLHSYGAEQKRLDSQKPVSTERPYLTRALSYMPPLLFLRSLTSKPEINSKLIKRVFGATNGVSMNRMVNYKDEDKALSKREDPLTDRHRYSMIDTEVDATVASSAPSNGRDEERSAPSKPLLLSAMTHAISSALESGLSSLSHASNLHPNKVGDGGDKSAVSTLVGKKDSAAKRNSQAPVAGGSKEQRQLSQFIPQAWKDVIKRTMSNVQQQASTQWRTIEGQLANWVQDKLKAPAASSTSASASANAQPAPASASNILASVGSSAMNMFGFGSKNSSAGSSSTTESSLSAPLNEASSSDSQKNKNDPAKRQSTAKSAIAGLTNMIASVFTTKQQSSSSSATSGSNSSKTTTGSESPPTAPARTASEAQASTKPSA